MAGVSKPGVQGFGSKSKVIGEFVEAIPEYNPDDNWKGKRQPFLPTPGVKEAMQRAYENPKKAMLLMEYTDGAPSKRKNMAILRVNALKNQGYTENAGWIVRAVEDKVYVVYTGAAL